MIKKIAVLTSGGDAPGMNAAVRSVVRTSLNYGLDVFLIYDGYLGLYKNKIVQATKESVKDTLNRGGTFLGTARLKEFDNILVQEQAVEHLNEHGIDALVAIGGDGTYRGALALSKLGIRTVGIPCTIDNDISGTDFTIGFDTALSTIVENVDKLRDTSSSHKRCSIIEVMGRDCGALAMWSALATGAEYVITKETGYNEEKLISSIKDAYRVKEHAIVLVAEKMLDINELTKKVAELTPFETRSTILGHVQRGGTPTARDRVLASLMGVKAVDAVMEGQSGVCVCEVKNEIVVRKFEDVLGKKRNQVEPLLTSFKKLW